MSEYVTEQDSPRAQGFADRWNSCSQEAREFAAAKANSFPGILPHVLAEIYDTAWESVVARMRLFGRA